MATKSKATASPAKAGNYAANRKRRLERTLKKQPNNKQVELALKDNPTWLRKKPNTPYWSHTMIEEAKLFKQFTGKMDLAVFSSIEATRSSARLHLKRDDWDQHKLPEGKVNFTLGARAHDQYGNLVWA